MSLCLNFLVVTPWFGNLIDMGLGVKKMFPWLIAAFYFSCH
ncbi:unnamed protein product [Spirodela intermedia]|uniref:Uncharacterized protein n=1 Tax=Spirodela intermedia TaxID=51605 RepID=A0A7I8JJ09_SPIIN|nr:unnamed protein product [Spirodela intermedia]CAA6670146.1 unnamed protein product [Spirodela intermedia]